MNFLERNRYLSPRNKGLVLSNRYRLNLDDSYKNCAIIGPTGCGKSSYYLIPNVLKTNGSCIVTDPSGEIFRATSGAMKKRGFKIQVLSPDDLDHSLRFNPIRYFNTPQELRQLAKILVDNGIPSTHESFWKDTALNIIYICISALKNCGSEEFIHLGNVRMLLNSLSLNSEEIDLFMSTYLDDSLFSEYRSFLAQDDKVIANILSSARAALDAWSDPEIVKLTASNSVNIHSMKSEKTLTYITVPEHKISYFSIILNLFITSCFKFCLESDFDKQSLPIFFFLDEFANCGKINDFPSFCTVARKRKVSISIVLQSQSQLESIYGKNDAETILSGGITNKLFFSGSDLKTCSYVEKLLGSETRFEKDEDSRIVGRPLLNADQVRRMNRSKCILISGSYRPAKIRMKPYFKDKRLRKLSKIEPVNISYDYMNEVIGHFKPKRPYLEYRVTVLDGLNNPMLQAGE